ncbi:MAG: hypothetical protein QF569_29540 [Candidatus Poribacteria bacterium]|nr:hypothetical protein [Candidatus Poribacteria bacterium]
MGKQSHNLELRHRGQCRHVLRRWRDLLRGRKQSYDRRLHDRQQHFWRLGRRNLLRPEQSYDYKLSDHQQHCGIRRGRDQLPERQRPHDHRLHYLKQQQHRYFGRNGRGYSL